MHILKLCFYFFSFHGVYRIKRENKHQKKSIWSVAIIPSDRCSYSENVTQQCRPVWRVEWASVVWEKETRSCVYCIQKRHRIRRQRWSTISGLPRGESVSAAVPAKKVPRNAQYRDWHFAAYTTALQESLLQASENSVCLIHRCFKQKSAALYINSRLDCATFTP